VISATYMVPASTPICLRHLLSIFNMGGLCWFPKRARNTMFPHSDAYPLHFVSFHSFRFAFLSRLVLSIEGRAEQQMAVAAASSVYRNTCLFGLWNLLAPLILRTDKLFYTIHSISIAKKPSGARRSELRDRCVTEELRIT
jgi:hypothetical protein